MQPELWARVAPLLDELLELAPADRPARLEAIAFDQRRHARRAHRGVA